MLHVWDGEALGCQGHWVGFVDIVPGLWDKAGRPWAKACKRGRGVRPSAVGHSNGSVRGQEKPVTVQVWAVVAGLPVLPGLGL